ncbi:MAG: hypothetical protein ABEJ73_12320 [Haloplanus sp.]
MDCPQCGGTLVTYALSDQEASVCEDCGYVGIPAEHRGEARRVESWDDALRRFYRTHDTDAEPSVEVRPPLSRPSEGSTDESWDDALRRFHARRTGATGDVDAPDAERDAESTEEDESAGDEADATADGEATAEQSAGDEAGATTDPSTDAGDADQSASRASQSQSSAGDS